jgi:hypothetical protein
MIPFITKETLDYLIDMLKGRQDIPSPNLDEEKIIIGELEEYRDTFYQYNLYPPRYVDEDHESGPSFNAVISPSPLFKVNQKYERR